MIGEQSGISYEDAEYYYEILDEEKHGNSKCNFILDIPLEYEISEENEFVWAVWKDTSKTEKADKRRDLHLANGFWDIYQPEIGDEYDSHGYICIKHLLIIFELVRRYFRLALEEDILKRDKQLNRDFSELKKTLIDKKYEDILLHRIEVGINIGFDHKYLLLWWNKKGRHKANTFSILNISTYVPLSRQIDRYYMRFHGKNDGLQWWWKEDKYRKFMPDVQLKCQLEASFQSNIAGNFRCTNVNCMRCKNGVKYCEHFNRCQVTRLNECCGKPVPEWNDNIPHSNAKAYFASFTFDAEDGTILRSMFLTFL